MAETRNCPQCDMMMDYRLGEYECPSCGHRESSKPAEAPAEQRKASGPGFKATPPPPPGMQVPGMPGSSMGGYHGSPIEPQPRQKDPGLEMEKKGILAYYVLQNLIILSWAYSSPGSALADRVGFMFLMALPLILGFVLLFFILQTDQDWLRYTCMGCIGLGILLNIYTLVGPGVMNQTMLLTPAMQYTNSLLSLAYGIWLVTILYRDMQR
ncbi:MAG: hypothetical protein H7A35_14220 [Planctomycetales bacterium]|nr:hypothetical protein [bacterium]UNM07992.1 MAG: hypothetical protein H7A35_14220 [Planctomycetales bacterium]